MNCRQVHKYLDDLLATGQTPQIEPVLEEHAVSCSRCRQEIEVARRTLAFLQPSVAIAPSPTLKEKIMTTLVTAEPLASDAPIARRSRRPWWRPALAGAAAGLVAVLAGIAILLRPAAPVYALQQTIDANRGLRSIHLRMIPKTFGHVGEIWARFDANGDVIKLRMNFPDTEDGPKNVLWEDGKAQVWFESKGSSVIVKDPRVAERLKEEFGAFDPKRIVDEIYRKSAAGLVKLEVSQPKASGEPITLTVTSATAPGRQDVYRVDPKTKLLQAHEVYRLKDGAPVLEATTEFLDYNQPIADSVFAFELPHGTVQIDQTTQAVGLVQGNLSDDTVAVGVVREFFTALINHDYAKAGQLYEGMPADKVKEVFGRLHVTRIISIGKPTLFVPNRSLRVPCRIEVERNGKTEVFEPHGPFVRQVYNQPGRWTICGGI